MGRGKKIKIKFEMVIAGDNNCQLLYKVINGCHRLFYIMEPIVYDGDCLFVVFVRMRFYLFKKKKKNKTKFRREHL